MRFNIGSFLTGLTAVAAGEQQGRREARLQQQQQAQQALVNHLREMAERRADEEMQMNRAQFQRSGEQWSANQAQQDRFHADTIAAQGRDDVRADRSLGLQEQQLAMQTDPTRILESKLYGFADDYENRTAYAQNVPAFARREAQPGLVDTPGYSWKAPGGARTPPNLGPVPTTWPRTVNVGRLNSEVEGERKERTAAQAQASRALIAELSAKVRKGIATEREQNDLLIELQKQGYDVSGLISSRLSGPDGTAPPLVLPTGQTAAQAGIALKGAQADNVKSQIADRTWSRGFKDRSLKIRTGLERGRLTLAEAANGWREEVARAKLELDRMTAAGKGSGGTASAGVATQKAGLLRGRIGRLEGQINQIQRGDDAEAKKLLPGLYENLNGLTKSFDDFTKEWATGGRVPGGPPVLPSASGKPSYGTAGGYALRPDVVARDKKRTPAQRARQRSIALKALIDGGVPRDEAIMEVKKLYP